MKKLLITTAALLLVLPMIVTAQDKDFQDTVFTATTDPGGAPLNENPPWTGGPYDGDDPINLGVANGATVWIGIGNYHILLNMKNFHVVIQGGAGLTVNDVIGYTAGGAYGSDWYTAVDSAGHKVVTGQIFPQPGWEVIVLSNPGGGAKTITTIQANTWCDPIPSMTTYGLGVLALLLIGSTVWILRRRKAPAAA